VPSQSPSLNLEEVANRVRESLVEDVRATVSAELTRALSGLPQASLDSQQLATVLEGVLRRVMPTASTSATSSVAPRGPTSSHDEPLFVPTNIVNKDIKGKVVLQSESSDETGDLDDAAAALREIKRQRGRTNG
jgi:hypothetical protein